MLTKSLLPSRSSAFASAGQETEVEGAEIVTLAVHNPEALETVTSAGQTIDKTGGAIVTVTGTRLGAIHEPLIASA